MLQDEAADVGTVPVRLVWVAAKVCKYASSLPERAVWPPRRKRVGEGSRMRLCHVPPDADQGWDDQVVLAAEAAVCGAHAPRHGAVLVVLVDPAEGSGALVHQDHGRAESVPDVQVGLEAAPAIHFDDKDMIGLPRWPVRQVSKRGVHLMVCGSWVKRACAGVCVCKCRGLFSASTSWSLLA